MNWHPRPSALALEGLLCVPLSALAIASADEARWDPFLLLLLLALAIASDLTAATLPTAKLKISGSFLSIVVAIVLLGGVPAAVIGVATIVVGWLRSREAAHRLITNVLVYASFPLLAGQAFASAVHATGAGSGEAVYSALVFGVFLLALGLDFLMVAGYLRYIGGPSIARSIRETVLPLLPSELAAALLTVGVTSLYHEVGVATIPFFGVVLLIFQYLMIELLKSQARAGELERQSLELQQSRESLRAFVSAAPIVLWAVDRSGSFLLVEGEHQDSLGLASARAPGASLFDLPGAAPELVEATKLALQGQLVDRIIEANGLTFEAQLSPLALDRQQVGGAIGVAIDISVRVETQRENEALADRLAQAQRLDSVGQLAGGIAHDFNNLLAVILTYASFVEGELEPGSPLSAHVGEIRAAADRAADLTSGLLQFSRHQPFTPALIDLNQCILETARLLGRTLGESVEVRTRLEPALWRITGDQRQLEQTLINLAVNARDAMPDGGDLTFSTSNRTLSSREARRLGDLAAGRYVRLRVADTGLGMTDDVRSRIFEPFFTTKEAGRGTGLGLATVYGMVGKAGGHIAVSSIPGDGTVFEIHWPRAAASAGSGDGKLRQRRGRDAAVPRGRGERMLVVEDQGAVRRAITQVLTEHGYDVIAVANGDHALGELANQRPIDLVLTDVVMPGMSGVDLARRAQEAQPGICVLFMSGYGYEAAGAAARRPGAKVLRKPFTPETLLARVSDELQSNRRHAALGG